MSRGKTARGSRLTGCAMSGTSADGDAGPARRSRGIAAVNQPRRLDDDPLEYLLGLRYRPGASGHSMHSRLEFLRPNWWSSGSSVRPVHVHRDLVTFFTGKLRPVTLGCG